MTSRPVSRLFATIWRPDRQPAGDAELLRAFAKAGNYVAGAFDGRRLVGACVGFFHAPAEDALHSHITGVSRAATAAASGSRSSCTSAPGRCARALRDRVDLRPAGPPQRLLQPGQAGAPRPTEYLPNFYGAMDDGINGGDDSDRLLVRWRLRDPVVARPAPAARRRPSRPTSSPRGAAVALGVAADGAPVAGRLDGDRCWSPSPTSRAPRRPTRRSRTRWRLAVREALTPLIADGGRVVGFDRTGWYVVTGDGGTQ